MILNQIDHVAIAVHDLEAAIKYYGKAFGAEVCHREIVEKDAVEEALIKVGESYIQLTTGTSPESPISTFLDKRDTSSSPIFPTATATDWAIHLSPADP